MLNPRCNSKKTTSKSKHDSNNFFDSFVSKKKKKSSQDRGSFKVVTCQFHLRSCTRRYRRYDHSRRELVSRPNARRVTAFTPKLKSPAFSRYLRTRSARIAQRNPNNSRERKKVQLRPANQNPHILEKTQHINFETIKRTHRQTHTQTNTHRSTTMKFQMVQSRGHDRRIHRAQFAAEIPHLAKLNCIQKNQDSSIF